MALQTLALKKEIGGFTILQERPKKSDGSVDWAAFDELRKLDPIYIDHDVNMISFRLQNGPIKVHGINGCQVDTLIHAAHDILEGLNTAFPCHENQMAIEKLEASLEWLAERTKNRVKRGVEGMNQA